MVAIGKYNILECVKKVDFGAYFDGGALGEILLPQRYEPENLEVGDQLELFVYSDSEDRLITTTEKPLAQVGEIAFMKIKDVNNIGAFADWGLMKDLLIPFREQAKDLKVGDYIAVAVNFDHISQRIVGSAKIDKYLNNTPPEYKEGEEVEFLAWRRTELGFSVIINHLHSAMIYENEIFQPIKPGDHLKGYIKKVREDEKIDCMLSRTGHAKMEGLPEAIMEALNERNGVINLSDKSSPEAIKLMFNCSKKAFKMALGKLYKEKMIEVMPEMIRRVK